MTPSQKNVILNKQLYFKKMIKKSNNKNVDNLYLILPKSQQAQYQITNKKQKTKNTG